jgi:ABC-type sugar transport system permease subunit
MRSTRAGATPYILLAPFLLTFAVFLAYPLVRSMLLATERSFGPGASASVGLENFRMLLERPAVLEGARNTLIFTAGSVFVQLPLALLLALALNRPNLRGRAVYRLIFFSPPARRAGVQRHARLADVREEDRADQHRAARRVRVRPRLRLAPGPRAPDAHPHRAVDVRRVQHDLLPRGAAERGPLAHRGGADRRRERPQRFFHVTLPAIRPVATFVVLLSIIGSVQLFELPFIIFGQTAYGGAGPENRALTLVMYLYQQAFETGDLGYASAIGWMIAVFLFAVGLSQLALVRKEPG